MKEGEGGIEENMKGTPVFLSASCSSLGTVKSSKDGIDNSKRGTEVRYSKEKWYSGLGGVNIRRRNTWKRVSYMGGGHKVRVHITGQNQPFKGLCNGVGHGYRW